MIIGTNWDQPFEEALDYFRSKGIEISPNGWRDIWQQANGRAFTVSRVTAMDVLEDIKDAVDKAIADGTPLSEFKKALSEKLEAKGWLAPQGEKAVIEMPDGTERKRLTGWRLDTIFETNNAAAFSVGRYKQQMDVKAMRPYWMYKTVEDSRVRPTHAAQDNKVRRADHPFWNKWYPPNGWNCFPTGTKVMTSRGWRRIESIMPGDRVVGGSGDEQRVTGIHRNPFNDELVRLIFENGRIDATPNHRILTMRGWVRAELLDAGDVLVQTAKYPGLDAFIGDEYMPDAEGRDGAMPLPIQRETAHSLAGNAEVQSGNKDIDPFRAKGSVNDMIMQRLKSKLFKVLKHQLFSLCGSRLAGGVGLRVPAYDKFVGGGIFSSDLRSACRRIVFKFNRRLKSAFVGKFCFSFSGVIAAGLHILDKFFHGIRKFLASFNRGVFPLGAHSIAALAGCNFEMIQEPHEGSVVDLKSRTELPVREFFNDIKPVKGVDGGAPLDAFDSLDDFRAWAGAHFDLRKIISVHRVPYNGIVCNLSVEKDESYQIQGATVHNCRCYVRTLSARQMESMGLIETKIGTDDAPDEGFAYNPGKAGLDAWRPDLSAYSPEARELLADELHNAKRSRDVNAD